MRFFLIFLSSLALVACQTRPSVTPPAVAATVVKPLGEGQVVPAVKLHDLDKKVIALVDLAKAKPLVVVFYRGGWCPFCNLQLVGLKKIAPDLEKLGYELVGISPDRPEMMAESVKKHKLSYRLLSDSPGTAAAAFGLAFKVDEETLTRYKGYGIDLEQASGERHFTLPVPAVIIVGRDLEIKYLYYNPDYKVRLNENELLQKAKELAQDVK